MPLEEEDLEALESKVGTALGLRFAEFETAIGHRFEGLDQDITLLRTDIGLFKAEVIKEWKAEVAGLKTDLQRLAVDLQNVLELLD